MLKRGVSPLIATVLLVMIVVSIGAAVMVVIEGLTEDQLENIGTQSELLECTTDVDIDLIQVDGKYRICRNVTVGTSNSSFTLYMENTGQKDIAGFRVVALGDDGITTNSYTSQTLNKGVIKALTFNISGVGDNNAELDQIEINPLISGRETITCREPTLVFDEEFLDTLEDCTDPDVTWDSSATLVTS